MSTAADTPLYLLSKVAPDHKLNTSSAEIISVSIPSQKNEANTRQQVHNLNQV